MLCTARAAATASRIARRVQVRAVAYRTAWPVTCSMKASLRLQPSQNWMLGSYASGTRVEAAHRLYSSGDYPSHEKIFMPALSPTMTQGNVASWQKHEGDKVTVGEVLAEIETDKAVMEFEASEDGYLAKILVPENTKDVPVGKLLCVIVESQEDVSAFKDFEDSGKSADNTVPAKSSEPEPSTPKPSPPEPKGRAQPPQNETLKKEVSEKAEGSASPAAAGGVRASPFARKMCKELGLDIGLISGSGLGGRVVESDVLAFAKSGVAGAVKDKPASAAAPAPAPAAYTDFENSNMRKTIAGRLLESKQTVPHYYLTAEVTMDNLLKLRAELNAQGKDEFKLSVNDFVIKASALACRDVPEANSAWMGSHIRQYKDVDVCVAVSTEAGLITPIIHQANNQGLKSISHAVKDLAARARASKLKPHEYQGGTFTVSNLGMYGVSTFSAIINPPQACILAVSSSNQRVVVNSQDATKTAVATVMAVTLSCDHRVVDGAVGAQWLQRFKAYLENPSTMLL